MRLNLWRLHPCYVIPVSLSLPVLLLWNPSQMDCSSAVKDFRAQFDDLGVLMSSHGKWPRAPAFKTPRNCDLSQFERVFGVVWLYMLASMDLYGSIWIYTRYTSQAHFDWHMVVKPHTSWGAKMPSQQAPPQASRQNRSAVSWGTILRSSKKTTDRPIIWWWFW